MKNKSIVLSGLIIMICASISFAQSGYLKIDDIKGESTDRGHSEWIEIESIKQGLEQQQAATGTSRRRGAVVLQDVIINKKLDKSTPKLMELCANGQSIPELTIDLIDTGKVKYKLTLENARISSIYSFSKCDPDCQIMDSVSISYTKITWVYFDSSGNTVKTSHDAKTGQ